MQNGTSVTKDVLRVRHSQVLVNAMCKKGEFKIPIHLALGHEAIAVAVDCSMQPEDRLVLSHRNIHYNLARAKLVQPEIDEYLLKKDGMAQGQLGSMNLANEDAGIVYTSSILGNNLPVAAGIALGNKVNGKNGVTIVVTGDGAMEEGSFHETLIFAKYMQLPLVIIIENNDWSLATMTHERRCPVNVQKIADSVNADYHRISSNDVYEYIRQLHVIREKTLAADCPVCLEVELRTLGYWFKQMEGYPPEGKFINYHSGPAPTVEVGDLFIEETDRDPVYALQKYHTLQELEEMSATVLDSLGGEENEIR